MHRLAVFGSRCVGLGNLSLQRGMRRSRGLVCRDVQAHDAIPRDEGALRVRVHCLEPPIPAMRGASSDHVHAAQSMCGSSQNPAQPCSHRFETRPPGLTIPRPRRGSHLCMTKARRNAENSGIVVRDSREFFSHHAELIYERCRHVIDYRHHLLYSVH